MSNSSQIHVVQCKVHSHKTGYDYTSMIAFKNKESADKHGKEQQLKLNKIVWLSGQVFVQTMELIDGDYENTFDLEHFEDEIDAIIATEKSNTVER